MEKFKQFVTRYVYPPCFFFTVFTAIIFLLSYSSATDAYKSTIMLFLYAFCYFIYLALINRILYSDFSIAARVALHYFLVIVPLDVVMLIFINASDNEAFSSNIVVLISIIVTVIYALIAVPVLIVRAKTAKKENETSKYKSQFDRA